MKFLIAGLGSIGRRHLRNLLALGERDILLYRTQLSSLPDDDLAGLPVETDLQTALQHRPEAVIIANPTALHLEIAIPCAEAGCSILMEKPVSHSFERIETLRQALEKHGSQFLTGFQFRYHPGLLQLKQWLTEERIGKITSIQAHWGEYLPNWHPWKDFRTSYSARPELGGGVVNTISHPFDYLRWLFGEVDSLQAIMSNQGLAMPVEDTADILMRFNSGSTANVHLDYIQRPTKHTLEVTGTGGRLTWDNTGGCAKRYDVEKETWEEVSAPSGFERNHLFLAEMSHFIRVIKREELPACTFEDGVAALEITQAVHRSAREAGLVKFRK